MSQWLVYHSHIMSRFCNWGSIHILYKFHFMRKIKFQEYFKLCNWWIRLQKNFDGYHVEQFVSSEEIKFWKVLRRCLWNIAASENNISLQNEKNSCCSSKRKLLTENDDFSYFQLFSTSPTPPPQMWDKLHCKKKMNRLPVFFGSGPIFCPGAIQQQLLSQESLWRNQIFS